MNESEMYEILKNELENQGYNVFPKLQFHTEKRLVGQDFIVPDVVACKGSEVWDIECKYNCTVAMFVSALGQIIGYRHLLRIKQIREEAKHKIGISRIDRIRFSIALMTTEQYPLGQQLEIFKKIVKEVSFPVGFLTIDSKSKVCTPHNLYS